MTERNQIIETAKIQKNCLSTEKEIRPLPKTILEECSKRKVFFSNPIILCNFAF